MAIEEIATNPAMEVQAAIAGLKQTIAQLERASEEIYRRDVIVQAGTDFIRRRGTLTRESERELRRTGVDELPSGSRK